MDDTDDGPSLPVTGAVFLGTAILIGLPTFAAVSGAIDALVGDLGPRVSTGTYLDEVLGGLAAAAFAYVVVSEIVAIRLGGTAALARGGRLATVGRAAAVGVWTVGALALLLVSITATVSGLWSLSDPLGVLIAVALLVAGGGLAYRTAQGAYRGYRGTAG